MALLAEEIKFIRSLMYWDEENQTYWLVYEHSYIKLYVVSYLEYLCPMLKYWSEYLH